MSHLPVGGPWPESEHYVVPGATHALQLVEPSSVANGLAQFIARQ